jgi:hypothetical protein
MAGEIDPVPVERGAVIAARVGARLLRGVRVETPILDVDTL